MSDTTSFADQLEQFSEHQLAGVSLHGISTSTVQLLLTTIFFTGAAISLAKQSNTDNKTYRATLRLFLENHFGLSTNRASGMIESNARLYKRFVLIERAYQAGWDAIRNDNNKAGNGNNELKALLKKYQNLSMSDLNSEGTKEQAVVPEEIEATPSIEPKALVVEPPSHLRRNILLILLIILACSAGYILFFTSYFSGLNLALENLIEEFIKPSLEHLSSFIRQYTE